MLVEATSYLGYHRAGDRETGRGGGQSRRLMLHISQGVLACLIFWDLFIFPRGDVCAEMSISEWVGGRQLWYMRDRGRVEDPTPVLVLKPTRAKSLFFCL